MGQERIVTFLGVLTESSSERRAPPAAANSSKKMKFQGEPRNLPCESGG